MIERLKVRPGDGMDAIRAGENPMKCGNSGILNREARVLVAPSPPLTARPVVTRRRANAYSTIPLMCSQSDRALRETGSLMGGRKWTESDNATLRQWYLDHADEKAIGVEQLAKQLRRSRVAVNLQAGRLGLTDLHRTSATAKCRDPLYYRKYRTDEELKCALSDRSKRTIREKGHPRGALGMKHTPETRAKISAKVRAAHAQRTPEEWYEMGRRGARTKVERYGTAGPVYLKEENAHSRTRGGKRADLDNRYFRSSWEANYARYLNWLVSQGEIQKWEYEVDTFVFEGYTRGAMTYRPDFKVTEKDGRVVYHEVKGWMDGPSKTRLKRMAKHYPDVKIIVIGAPEYKAISRWKVLIPEWE